MIVSGEFKELMRDRQPRRAAKRVPDAFETAALEELLGGDLDKPLSPAELAQRARRRRASTARRPRRPTHRSCRGAVDEHNVGVDAVRPGLRALAPSSRPS